MRIRGSLRAGVKGGVFLQGLSDFYQNVQKLGALVFPSFSSILTAS